jgi:YegS/Rv2252/BmrU family lipid kinase
MKVKVILNPYANRWGAKQRIEQVKSALNLAGVDFDLDLIPAPKEGTRLAREAVAQGYDAVIGAGGDGTSNEIINGLIQAAGDAPTVPYGVFPIGTGNDFSDMAGLPRDLRGVANVIAGGKVRLVDAGKITYNNGVSTTNRATHTHYFLNNCAVAMEPMATIENEKITRLSGNLRYIVAVTRSLIKLKAWYMDIRWDDGEYNGPTYLLSVCNGPRAGGQFLMAPHAHIDDGLFDFTLAPEVPKLTVLSILARLFRGTHIHHPQVTYKSTAKITITSTPPSPIHADGELLSAGADSIVYEILPQKITLLTP